MHGQAEYLLCCEVAVWKESCAGDCRLLVQWQRIVNGSWYATRLKAV